MKLKKNFRIKCLLPLTYLVLVFAYTKVRAQSKLARKYNVETMAFKGTKNEQALYLLRKVKKAINGVPQIDALLEKLPGFLDSLMKKKILIADRQRFIRILSDKKIIEKDIGGSLSTPLSTIDGVQASYFVIHDASNLIAKENAFPAYVDASSWPGNDVAKMKGFKNAHIFINRIGKSITVNDFSKTVRGTKFESYKINGEIGKNANGRFLHIELIQPRMSEGSTNNDAIAILPGFTEAQYKRLAFIYIAGSLRKGEWLIPTFHAVLDEGIPGGHDDPQNFDLEAFVLQIKLVYDEIKPIK